MFTHCAPIFSLFCVMLFAVAEGSTCVVLCVSESLNGVQGALLASIMDIVGIRHENDELLSPLTHPDSLKILQSSQDSHMLQLLLPRAETHTVPCESGTAPAPACTTTTPAKVSDISVLSVVLSNSQHLLYFRKITT